VIFLDRAAGAPLPEEGEPETVEAEALPFE
jgi:hypothetical protein